jgi:hypothetical protein
MQPLEGLQPDPMTLFVMALARSKQFPPRSAPHPG